MRHAVIMAGGAGVRLWPLSRKNHPKQLLRLFAGASLLRRSYERLAGLLSPEQINVITNRSHLPMVAGEIPELPPDNLLGEPVGRDTAAAVGLACAVLHRRDPDAVIGIFTADHVIAPVDRFRETVDRAYNAAEQHGDALVTLGIKPTRPDTNYGYIHRGEGLGEGLYRVKRFAEKPEVALAREYLDSGEYYWNGGMFVWRAETILEQLKKHLPESFDQFCEIADAWGSDRREQKLESLYPSLQRISIDYAVMERAEPVLVVELSCEWVDVGSWTAIESIIPADGAENINACPRALHLGSRNNIVASEEKHLIATIGVDDLVVVHAPDATLICSRHQAGRIKELVENLRREYGKEYT